MNKCCCEHGCRVTARCGKAALLLQDEDLNLSALKVQLIKIGVYVIKAKILFYRR